MVAKPYCHAISFCNTFMQRVNPRPCVIRRRLHKRSFVQWGSAVPERLNVGFFRILPELDIESETTSTKRVCFKIYFLEDDVE